MTVNLTAFMERFREIQLERHWDGLGLLFACLAQVALVDDYIEYVGAMMGESQAHELKRYMRWRLGYEVPR